MPEPRPASDPPCHDVLIVGGGLVGASLAIALDGLGLDVAQVEAAPPGALPPVFDQRNLSFADATVNALTALGIMQELRMPPGPIRRIHVSRAGDFGRVRLDAADYGRGAFGQVVVASDFGHALEARMGRLQDLVRYRPARFVGCGDVGDARAVRIAEGDRERTVHARLLVGADGAASGVRAALGIGADAHDYGQTLLVARVRASRVPDGTAWERFTAHGPTALLPRGDRHYGVVHGVAREEAGAAMDLDEAGFLARIQAATDLPLNLEMAATDEMLEIALRHSPHAACIVPEKREEVTTEGGLDAAGQHNRIQPIVSRLADAGIRVSLFIAPDERQLEAALRLGVPVVEFHTGEYAHATGEEVAAELRKLAEMAALAAKNGIEPHAGHGLTYENVQPVAAIPQLAELNIGHYLVGEAVFVGLEAAVTKMRQLMDDAR